MPVSSIRGGTGPLLVLLAARFGDPHLPDVVSTAVAVELTHRAALGHERVRDAEAAGRTRPDPGAPMDTSVALLAGDFLFARASQILADLGPQAVRVQTTAYARVVTGQILGRRGPDEGCDPVAQPPRGGSRANGLAHGCLGAARRLAAGADDRVGDVLARYGERLGTALRLTDDVLGPTDEVPLRADAPTGQCPAQAQPAPRRALRDALCRTRQARAALNDLPDCAARDALAGLCDAAAARARR
ncbi:geranylgeranyl pyrophosphate synthase [Streptomyces sp. SA15]|uniref:polyprenyl synthetase family protein n=1 Tax=Streptomyces sp. SA15 TaxID=934019 RepID=UPI000BAF5017|nr:polyprenyl synthetase family protein [Streptomyces sp. SA15]PAZ13042.1 geranylgeranyl pyrophosphate synthase [Streptomyces sp. SA15]